MLLRRHILWIIPICLLLFWGESLLLFSFGMIAKTYLRLQKGMELNFTSVEWKDRGLVFSDLSLKDPDHFSVSVPQVVFNFHTKHIRIRYPHIYLHKIPSITDGSSSPWTYAIEDGWIEGDGFQGASFSFSQDALSQKEFLATIGNASISANTYFDKDQELIHISCDQFPLSYLKFWTGRNWEGTIQGSFRLAKKEAGLSILGGCIVGSDIGCEGIAERVCGQVDWDGFSDIFFHPNSSHSEGRLRLHLSDGTLLGKEKKWIASKIQGDLSFDGSSGAKWEMAFVHLDKKVQGCGRGFIQSIQGPWFESELRFQDALVGIHFAQKNEETIWDINAKSLQSEEILWLEDFFAALGFSSFPFTFDQGVANGLVQFHVDKRGKVDWKVVEGTLKNICLSSDRFSVSCKEIWIRDGLYSFQEGSFSLNRVLQGENWQGNGDLISRKGEMSGKIGEESFVVNFEGSLESLAAEIALMGGIEGSLSLQTKWQEESLSFSIHQGFGAFFSSFSVDNFEMHGELGFGGLSCFDVRGILDIGKRVPFYCPIFQTEGQFDVRFEHPLFDWIRIAGTSKGGEIRVDPKRSHLFGESFQSGTCHISEAGIDQVDVVCKIPWKLFPVFLEIPKGFEDFDLEDFFSSSFSFRKERGLELELIAEKSDVHLRLTHSKSLWRLDPSRLWGCLIEASFKKGKEGIQIIQGKGFWKNEVQATFVGRISSLDKWNLTVSSVRVDLGAISPFKSWGLEGVLEGDGIVDWQGELESDFDLVSSSLKINGFDIENATPIHAYCSSKKGVSVRGVNLSVIDPNQHQSMANCKVGLFQYDLEQVLFVFTQFQFHISPDFLIKSGFEKQFSFLALPMLQEPVHGIADLAFSSDFSSGSVSLKELDIPIDNTHYQIQNLHFDIENKECKMSFDLDHQSQLIPMDLSFCLDPLVKGRLTVENGLKIDWVYQDRLCLQSIVGVCSGIDASFHLEGGSLIGSAKVNGNKLKELLPEKIARVFHELKIGDGYELMGRLFFSDLGLGFKGILSGKQIELFDFEFKNILGQIEWDANHFHISDLKVSDFAGVLTIDHILAEGMGEDPWTISIPHILITELRPSLLQDVGKPPGKLSPLLVRELRIDDFKGFVDDGKTYTAKGQLYFINSYKREKSILELPSDWLSRIVGLDFDLMIPVCGTLVYELHDGFFHFTQLSGSYSENKRSEFFLVYNEDSPKMDLDWNLNILIQMKQFVLFKFTEAFIISVTGKLDDPKLQLHRKNRFLGNL
jgi:hypothetical protein